MKLSDASLALLASLEGFSPTLYNDPSGNATIGYGHMLHKGTVLITDKPTVISHEDARVLLAQDVAQKAERFVRTYVIVPLTQNQFDALVIFCYNLGAGVLKTVVSETGLNFGDYHKVPPKILEYTKSRNYITGQLVELPGLAKRRKIEAELFARG